MVRNVSTTSFFLELGLIAKVLSGVDLGYPSLQYARPPPYEMITASMACNTR